MSGHYLISKSGIMIILKDPIIQNSSKSLGSDPVCNLIGYE
jgi:hypothetical protein